MNDQEKSAMLARAMGWCWRRQNKVDGFTRNWWHLLDKDKKRIKRKQVHWVTEKNDGRPVLGRWQDRSVPDLYAPENAHLAWLIHIWALSSPPIKARYYRWWKLGEGGSVWLKEDAQRIWLDKIFALVIKAGLVEVDDE